MQTSRAQTSRHAGASPASRTGGHWGNWQTRPALTRDFSWFESRVASHAAAHGCGPALVQRVTRVGTGWRLCVLVLQLAERPGREPGCCGFDSRRAHHAALAHLAERPPCKR